MQVKSIFLFKKFVLPLIEFKICIMEILKLLRLIEKESDNYFVLSNKDIDIDYIVNLINENNFNLVRTIMYGDYIVIFNIQKERELNNVIHLSLNTIQKIKKDSV